MIKNKSLGFPGGSDGKKSACNVGDMSSIPGSGRSPEGGHGTHSRILPRESPEQRSLEGCSPWGHGESNTNDATEHTHI